MRSWRTYTDLAKRSPMALRVADRLGRGKGRLRVLDHMTGPRLPEAPYRPDLSKWNDRALGAAWIGHATMLIRIGGLTILTDPVFGHRVGIGLGIVTAGPRRLVAPALRVPNLPPLNLILLSHAHFDHLDRPTLRRLPKATPIVTAHNTQDLVRDLGFKQVRELRWGERCEVQGVTITAIRPAHWGARTFYDVHRGFNAYLIESSGGKRVLYGGDTAYTTAFQDVGGSVDLAIFGIGAYHPYIAAHANPEQVWTMANHVRADRIASMHHSTFCLSHEPMGEPLERFLSAAGNDVDRIVIREPGQSWVSDK